MSEPAVAGPLHENCDRLIAGALTMLDPAPYCNLLLLSTPIRLAAKLDPSQQSRPGPLDVCSRSSDVFACAIRHDRVPGEWTPVAYAALPHMLVAGEGEDRGYVDQGPRGLGLTRTVALTVPHFLSAPAIAAESGLCLTLARRVLAPVSGALGLALLEPPVTLPAIGVRAYWHRRDDADPAHMWIRSAITEVSAKLGLYPTALAIIHCCPGPRPTTRPQRSRPPNARVVRARAEKMRRSFRAT